MPEPSRDPVRPAVPGRVPSFPPGLPRPVEPRPVEPRRPLDPGRTVDAARASDAAARLQPILRSPGSRPMPGLRESRPPTPINPPFTRVSRPPVAPLPPVLPQARPAPPAPPPIPGPGPHAPGAPRRPGGISRPGTSRRTSRPRWSPARQLRAAEPAPQRLPALLHDRRARRDPDPGAAPAQGAHPPGPERLALPAPRRRPPRAGLRQRRLPLAALQPVRLLRGRPRS